MSLFAGSYPCDLSGTPVDARIEAIYKSKLVLSKTWLDNTEEAREDSIAMWMEVVHLWYIKNEQWASSIRGKRFLRENMEDMFRTLRKLNSIKP